MGKIFCIMGKSASGKDTIYKNILKNNKLSLKNIVLYTTRPKREGEEDKREYYFVDEEQFQFLKKENKIIEERSYDTVYGLWRYFTVNDEQINLEDNNYLVIGTLESYQYMRAYFGDEIMVPIYVELEDGIRLQRALDREKVQKNPKYEEMCRRFLADSHDFSDEKITESGITEKFYNENSKDCTKEILDYMERFCH